MVIWVFGLFECSEFVIVVADVDFPSIKGAS